MRGFIVERNIERFKQALLAQLDPAERKEIEGLLATAKRELADLDRDEAAPHRTFPTIGPEK